ncbi:ArsC/Spx/MgsR family protein [Echinicola sediminis]
MKKTFKLLDEIKVDYQFVDYKKEHPSSELIQSFLDKVNLESLVNKRGTTYRKLSEDVKEKVDERATAIPLLIENSSMIKRPVMVYPDGEILVGFDKSLIENKK